MNPQPKSPHTPGPWRVETLPDGRQTVLDANDDCACVRANARLIAAAPELLEALKALQKSIRHAHHCRAPIAFPCSCDANCLDEQARSAISRATGNP